jgi:hypothetical protein
VRRHNIIVSEDEAQGSASNSLDEEFSVACWCGVSQRRNEMRSVRRNGFTQPYRTTAQVRYRKDTQLVSSISCCGRITRP